MPYQSQESEKEVRQATGFSSAGVTTTGDLPHGSQPWRDREPQGNEGQAVSNWKPLTVGAIHPKAVSVSCFLPASSREKRARKRNPDGSATI